MEYKEKLIELLNSMELTQEQQEKLQEIFPETVETEYEKTKKAIINGIINLKEKEKYEYFGDIRIDDAIDWIKNQTDVEPESDNKEPKFKVGDWIINNFRRITRITEIKNGWYNTVSITGITSYFSIEYGNSYFHLWTINDAKPGDILIHARRPFIFMGIEQGLVKAFDERPLDGTKVVNFDEPATDDDYQPATMEQRDVLVQKLANAGYEWDAETLTLSGTSMESLSETYKYKNLKSLKPNHWRPTENEIEALKSAINALSAEDDGLTDLLIDLEKL